jgi:hypothetical protein
MKLSYGRIAEREMRREGGEGGGEERGGEV